MGTLLSDDRHVKRQGWYKIVHCCYFKCLPLLPLLPIVTPIECRQVCNEGRNVQCCTVSIMINNYITLQQIEKQASWYEHFAVVLTRLYFQHQSAISDDEESLPPESSALVESILSPLWYSLSEGGRSP